MGRGGTSAVVARRLAVSGATASCNWRWPGLCGHPFPANKAIGASVEPVLNSTIILTLTDSDYKSPAVTKLTHHQHSFNAKDKSIQARAMHVLIRSSFRFLDIGVYRGATTSLIVCGDATNRYCDVMNWCFVSGLYCSIRLLCYNGILRFAKRNISCSKFWFRSVFWAIFGRVSIYMVRLVLGARHVLFESILQRGVGNLTSVNMEVQELPESSLPPYP